MEWDVTKRFYIFVNYIALDVWATNPEFLHFPPFKNTFSSRFCIETQKTRASCYLIPVKRERNEKIYDMRTSCNIMSFAYVDLGGRGYGFCVLQ